MESGNRKSKGLEEKVHDLEEGQIKFQEEHNNMEEQMQFIMQALSHLQSQKTVS